MGCASAKSATPPKQQVRSTVVVPEKVSAKQEFGQEGEDEVAIVETAPKQQKTPKVKGEDFTDVKLKNSDKQFTMLKTSEFPPEHSSIVSEPNQPKVKAALQFESLGAAHINLEELIEQPQESPVVKTSSNARRKNELDDLLADLDASSEL